MHYVKVGKIPLEPLLAQTTMAHEVALQILRSPELLQVIESLYSNERRQDVSGDPTEAARKAGVDLPEGSRVYIHQFDEGWEVEVHAPIRHGLVIVGFNSVRGFYTK